MSGSPGRPLAWILLGAGLLAAALAHLAAPVSPYDDAYIIFRYVDNVVEGRGAVFNPGERVFGLSCPLYAAWLVLLKSVFPWAATPVLAARGNLVFAIAAGLLVFALMRRLGKRAPASALAGLLVLASPMILRPSLGGMDSSLFIALLFGTCLATAAGRDAAGVLLASLAALARPEGVLLLPIVAAARLLDRGARNPGPGMAAGLAPLALWAAGAAWYYGTPIPHSVIAKASGLYPLPSGTALMDLLGWAGRLTVDGLAAGARTVARLAGAGRPAEAPIPEPLYRLLGLAFIAWLLWRWWSLSGRGRAPRALALPAFLLLALVFYAVSNPLMMPWYIPLVCAPALALAPGAGPWGSGAPRRGTLLHAAIPLLVLATVLSSYAHQLRPTSSSLFTQGAASAQAAARLAAYERTARWIESHSAPSESVAAPEIGILGYSMERRILDPCGLISPEALPFLPVPAEQRGDQPGVISVDFVMGTRPDLVATLPVFASLSLLRSEWFDSHYEKVHEEPCLPDDPRYSAVLVFRRRP